MTAAGISDLMTNVLLGRLDKTGATVARHVSSKSDTGGAASNFKMIKRSHAVRVWSTQTHTHTHTLQRPDCIIRLSLSPYTGKRSQQQSDDEGKLKQILERRKRR